ncbi:helix-turn-helix transcriptional regulator [Streptomyces sp. NPDC048521]|uniref:helix-turn-helix domain-containing protein n=1 Tax=Streptomyces sp. NPDC048521 TaxID=3365566 RepID=UPI00371A28DB
MTTPSRRIGSFGDPLTDRQLRTLQLAAEGLTQRQMASKLSIQESSVSYLVSEVLVRLGAHNITHAVFLACRDGVLEPRRRHGDHAGFVAHQRRGEDPWACELGCPEGERAYRRGRRAARKAAAV